MTERLVVASNRGPVSWQRGDDGGLEVAPSSGGLVTALGGALSEEDGTWVSLALGEADQEVAAANPGPFPVEAGDRSWRVRLLDVGDRYDPYYNEVANRLLWFTVHGLWGEPYEPRGEGWRDAWTAYTSVGEDVARAVVEAVGDHDGEVHLQDYHLCGSPRAVRAALPRARILHYLHTPWVGPSELRRLPDAVSEGVLAGLLGADVVAVSSPAWAAAFRRGAVQLLGAVPDGDDLWFEGRRVSVASFVLGVDADALRTAADDPDVRAAGERIDAERDGRALLVRVDRTDLSKNVLRGLRAYELLLERHPEHRDRVWHYAILQPSRQGVEEYRDYLEACTAASDRIRDRFGERVLTFFLGDDYPAVLACYERYDVQLTTPVRDGTNLVAKEGPTLNQRDGVLVLSRDAGAADVLRDGALMVNAYDVEQQAEALHAALTMDADERRERAELLRRGAAQGAPHDWFGNQRATLRAATTPRVERI
jgi:trehalose 6-phosphate synthase